MGEEKPCLKIEPGIYTDDAVAFYVLSEYSGKPAYVGRSYHINNISSTIIRCIRASKEAINGVEMVKVSLPRNFLTFTISSSDGVVITSEIHSINHKMPLNVFIETMKGMLRKIKEHKWNVKLV